MSKIEEIAKHLPGWRVVMIPHDRQVLQDEAGRQFIVSALWNNKSRLEVLPEWPTSKYCGQQWPRDNERIFITVAENRPAEAIATDIQRRFLPQFIEVWDKYKAIGDERDAYAEATTKLFNELRQLINPSCQLVEISDKDKKTTSWDKNIREVRIVGKDRVTIELECSGAEAKEIIKNKLAKPVPTEE